MRFELFASVFVLLVVYIYRSSLGCETWAESESRSFFNMCVFFVCFATAAEYGSVICDGVEMADIPQELQEARVFKLHLANNGLHRFPDAKLQGTGNCLHHHNNKLRLS